jgi:hypothetical protein
MVNLEQNTLYIIIAIIVVAVLIIAVLIRRRRSKKGPSNINQYLEDEAKTKKLQIVERAEGFTLKKPLYMMKTEDKIGDLRDTTSQLEHKNAFYNRKVEDKTENLESLKKQVNLQKQLKMINRKHLELNTTVKTKE